MSKLSRRSLVAGAASLPALVTVEAAPLAASDPDAELITLGERLKAAWAETEKLKPDRRLWEACQRAAGFRKAKTDKARAAAERRFKAMAQQNGYHEACEKWNAAGDVQQQIAQAILKIPSHTRIGDGVRAAAALCEGDGLYCKDVDLLWEMAGRAGFPHLEQQS